jgi:hypothetical protein
MYMAILDFFYKVVILSEIMLSLKNQNLNMFKMCNCLL